ncbi:class I adenylate-forming enzyme family protein [Propionicicella superfundia]|uniref:class I adenylate-forming enzyme family protein n=1 Tax=Propionicicella superfundia TaxID=348582 RepID=UPI00040EFA5E|nr:class I adenylate-forming enzyme family protein [Propionicicella superfundia]
MTLAGLIGGDERAATPAVIDPVGAVSRADLFARATALAAGISAAVPGTARIGVRTSTDAQGVVDVLAALLSGRPAAMLPADASPEQQAAASGCAALLHDGLITPVSGVDPSPRLDTGFGIPAGGSREAVVLFTSGTTHLPRGVRLTEAGIVANLTAMLRLAVRWGPSDRVGQILTLSHSFGLSMALLALATRTPLVMLPDGPPSRRLAAGLTDGEVTVFACVPYYLRLMATRGIELGGDVAPRLAHLYLAGGGIGDDDLAAVVPRFRGETYLMYGFTEATARVAVRRGSDGAPPDSVGLPLPGTHVRIVDETGAPVPAGTTGRIQVYSPSLMIGYLGSDPRPPGEPVTTTDLGHLDEAGNLFVTGREAEMLNFRGNRVSVVAVEAVVNLIPGVRESLLHPDGPGEDAQGELLVVAADDADQRAIRRQVLSAVTPKGLVRQVTFVADLPRTRSGKALRR